MKKCVIKKDILTDAKIVIEPNMGYQSYWRMTAEEKAEFFKDWIKDFRSFLRDHRSQDIQDIDIELTKEDQCSNCEEIWESAQGDGSAPDFVVGATYCAHCGAELEILNNLVKDAS